MAKKAKAKRPFEDTELEEGPDIPKAYCVKCKKKNQKISDPVLVATYMSKQDAWRPRITGTHAKCGTTLTVFTNQEFVDDVFG